MAEPIRHPKPKWFLLVISVALLIGMGSLVLSIQNAFQISEEGDQREQERIEADLGACERGNLLRQAIISIGHASGDLDESILDRVFNTTNASPERAAAIDALRADLQHLVDQFRDEVAEVTLIDCKSVVPGA